MSGSIQMPKYKCHKEVWALKIEQVKADNVGRAYLHFSDERYAPIEIANGWLMKHMPVPGGYYVQYQDGYASYSPAEAFESGYAPVGESKNWRSDLTKFESDVLEALGLGDYTPDSWKSVALTCLGNAVRRSECLSRIENYMVEIVQDDEDEEPAEESLLRWGQEPDEYIETFKVALPEFVQQQSPVYITGKELEPDEIKDLVEALPDTVFINRPDAVLVPDPSKNEMSVAFRLAAQIAGIKDEVSDFMAGLDGALLAGKSIEDLHDEIMERIALYDTPEAVDLFMNLVKTRKASLPDGLTPEAIELLKGLPFPHRRIAMVFDAPNLGDGYMVPEVVQAFNESHRRSDWGKYPFTASNDITINVINLSAGGSPGEIGVEPSLQPGNKTNQQGQIELLTAALDAARHELDGKYISANATVIDACQMPIEGSLSGFTEWSDKVGFTEYNKMRLSSEGKTLEVNPGDWVVTYLNAEPGRMVFNSFEPEIFEALYTSAAELLGVK